MGGEYQTVVVDEERVKDIKNIAHGVYAPLTGFMKYNEFHSVLEYMYLPGGQVWTMPIVLDVSRADYRRIRKESAVALVDAAGKTVAVLDDIELFTYDKKLFVEKVFQTGDSKHPGVAGVYRFGDYLLGGRVRLRDSSRGPFAKYNFTPRETKALFRTRGWRSIVAFQTRNVPHRAHEFLQMSALSQVDGLFIQPVIGRKKAGDFRDEIVVSAYEKIMSTGWLRQRACLGVLPLNMRYAGPREAVWHALIRKNFGCTHFIVGRDHAGVGNYYGSYDAQNIFDLFTPDEIGIEIIKYENATYCRGCGKITFEGTCKHGLERRESLSGAKIREMIVNNKNVSSHIMRPIVVKLIRQEKDPFFSE